MTSASPFRRDSTPFSQIIGPHERPHAFVWGWRADALPAVGEFCHIEGDGTLVRDAYGAVPAYHRQRGADVVVSPFFEELARPGGDVDERALFETLVLGHPVDPESTLVREVRRVPPGHRVAPLTSAAAVPWFETPAANYAAAVDPGRHVARFWDLFVECVEDRLTAYAGADVVISLSGGLDSVAIAAAIREAAPHRRVLGLTLGFRGHAGDREPGVAQTVAEHLGLEWELIDVSKDDPLAALEGHEARAGGPASVRRWAALTDGALTFYGYGGDALLRGDPAFWRSRLRNRQWRGAGADFAVTTLVHGLRPGFGLQKRLRRPQPAALPIYLLERHATSARRLLESTARHDRLRGPVLMQDPVWSSVFEEIAQTYPGSHLSVPLLDPRLAAFASTTPTAPWFIDKEILRAALRGRIPDAVRLRPKTPVHIDPELAFRPENVDAAIRDVRASGMRRFVDVERFEADLRRGGCRFSRHSEIVRVLRLSRFLLRFGGSE